MKILAIIPAFNEEECIESTVGNLVTCCPDIDYVVIDDGSTDRTAEICQRENLNHVSLAINSGLASAFQTGMKYALRHGYDAAVQFDADGQHMPQFLHAMRDELANQDADIVIGSRVKAGEQLHGARGIGSKLISLLIRITTGTSLTDPTSGLRMYHRRMIEQFANDYGLTPEPDTIALLARKGARVVEVPAQMQERQGGKSYLDFTHVLSYMTKTCLSILLFQWFR